MQDKAKAAGIQLSVARPLEQIHQSDGAPIQFGLAGAYQRTNAALAVELAACWEERVIAGSGSRKSEGAAARLSMLQSGRLPEPYQDGLQQCVWPGRAQVASAVHCLALSFIQWLAHSSLNSLHADLFAHSFDGALHAHVVEQSVRCA